MTVLPKPPLFTGAPMAQITPFTYREGATLMYIVERLKRWSVEFGPEVQAIIDTAVEELKKEVDDAKDEMNDAKDAWQTLFDRFMADVVAQIEALNDQAVAGLIRSTTSEVRNALLEIQPHVDVKLFGAKGDGVTDDTAAIQAALDSGAKSVFVPNGVYPISDIIRPHAGQKFYTDSGVLKAVNPNMTHFIQVYGSYIASAKVEISANVGIGATVIPTKTAHTFQRGDILRLVSQRVSTSDAAGDWRLGFSTGTLPGSLFSEFVRVQGVADKEIEIDAGLVFPFYQPNASGDTEDGSGTSAYLAKFDGSADYVTISGFTLEGDIKNGIKIARSIGSEVSHIKWTTSTPGRFIEFEDVYACHAKYCHIRVNQWEKADVGISHADINVYHMAAGFLSGFDNCRSERGTQPFDITYNQNSRYSSVYCYVKNSTSEGALANAMTVHPGVYAARITDNDFQMCSKNGVSCRAKDSIISGNRISGSGFVGGAGIYLHEGGGVGSDIFDNIVENFDEALRINDGANKPYKSVIDITFRNNTLRNYTVGFYRSVQWNNPLPDIYQGVQLIGNRFHTDKSTAVAIRTSRGSRGINGLLIMGNEVRHSAASLVNVPFVEVTANSKNIIIKDNMIIRATTLFTYVPDGFIEGEGKDSVEISGNNTSTVGSLNIPAPSTQLSVRNYGSVQSFGPANYHLDDIQAQFTWRTGSSGEATVAKGYPVEFVGSNCMGRNYNNLSIVLQEITELSGNMRTALRRRTASGWTTWVIKD